MNPFFHLGTLFRCLSVSVIPAALLSGATLFALCPSAARGASFTFRGTITQTIYGSANPSYPDGSTFTGYYEYISPTIDGVFHTPDFSDVISLPPGTNQSLQGLIYLPFIAQWDGDTGPDGPHEFSEGGNLGFGRLVVSGGVVSAFYWSFETGGYYAELYSGSYYTLIYNDLWLWYPPDTDEADMGREFFYHGALIFGAPSQVPDNAQTTLMLLLGLVALVLARLPTRPLLR